MSTQYASQWKAYRRRHWAATVGLLLGLPAACFVGYLGYSLNGVEIGVALLLAGSAWAAAWLWLCLRVTRFPCPHCSKPFLASQEPVLAATRYCANCGLQLYGSEP